MKKTFFGILATCCIGMLIVGFVVSCKSTGTSAPQAATATPAAPPVPAPAAPVSSPNSRSTFSPDPRRNSEDAQILEQIYEQHDNSIILTGAAEYTVIKGDTLSKIARENYGAGTNAYFFPLIIAASKGTTDIIDPDEIEVGMQLIIPDLDENLSDPVARDNLKNLLKAVADFYSLKSGRLSVELHNGLTQLYNAM
jgi:hypothetical protein